MSSIAPPSHTRRDGLAATNLANSSTKNKRRELDFYPTPPACTVALLDFLNLPMNTVIWEPACGEGAIVDVCRQYGYPTVGTDIINGMDFLTCTNAPCHNWIITNPPFNLSEKFIERAASIPNTKFAFLLKSQFWHARKRLDIFRLHPPAYILPLTSSRLHGGLISWVASAAVHQQWRCSGRSGPEKKAMRNTSLWKGQSCE